jgi:hypothetical protein
MNKAVVIPVLAAGIAWAACGGGASAAWGDPGAAQWKIIVNGQDISGHVPGMPTCYTTGPLETNIQILGDNQQAEVTPDNQVVYVMLYQEPNSNWGWFSAQSSLHQGGPGPGGDATVTKSGNTYKITGHVSPTGPSFAGQQPALTGTPVPFEFDATCP